MHFVVIMKLMSTSLRFPRFPETILVQPAISPGHDARVREFV